MAEPDLAIADQPLPPPPRWVRRTTAVVSTLLVISSLGGIGLSLGGPLLDENQPVVWMMFGFEVVLAVTGVIGVLIGLGRFGDGPGMALGVVAGTTLVASLLGYVAANGEVAGIDLTPKLLVRLGMAAVLGLGAAACVLGRHPRSWPMAIGGVLLLLPVAGAASLVLAPVRRMASPLFEAAMWVRVPLIAVGLVVLAILFCAGVHLVVRAFELGAPENALGARKAA